MSGGEEKSSIEGPGIQRRARPRLCRGHRAGPASLGLGGGPEELCPGVFLSSCFNPGRSAGNDL